MKRAPRQNRTGSGLTLIAFITGLMLLSLGSTQARANVYAAHLTPAGTNWDFTVNGPMSITYRLNQPATTVTVEIFRQSTPATVIKSIPGTTTYGLNTVSWDGTDNSSTPVSGGGDYCFRVIATDSVGASAWTNITPLSGGSEIGSAQYAVPNGVTVNRDQTSPNFGRIYISNGSTAFSSNPGASAAGKGLFLLNSDMTFRGGTAATGAAAANASITTLSTSTSSPWKVSINQDNPDEIVLTDFADTSENVWIFNGDGTTVTEILKASTTGPTTGAAFNHGNNISAALTGLGANRKLWDIDEDKDIGATRISGGYDLIRFDIGAISTDYTPQGAEAMNGGAALTGPPAVANFYTGRDMSFGRVSGTSRVYIACRRALNTAGNLAMVCYTLSAAGVVNGDVWNVEDPAMSTSTGRTWIQSCAIAVDEARSRGAVGSDSSTTPNASGGFVSIFNTGTGAYITSFASSVAAGGTITRGLDFDAAGNLYTTNATATDQHVRMWSPPDGPNTYTTTYFGLLGINCSSGPPTINTQPTGGAVCVGDSFTFTVSADGHGVPLLYQWKHGSTNVGTDSPSLTINPVSLADAGTYTCTITGCGTLTTNPVTLAVGPTITSNPADQPHKCAGGSASFTVAATGPTSMPVLLYQWYKGATALTNGTDANGVAISGATSATLTLTNLSVLDNNALYSCKITDQCGTATTVTSGNGKLSFDIPVISAQPASVGVYVGKTANFSVTATDPLGVGLAYQWRENAVDIPGANASTLALVTKTTDNNASISVVITSACGPTTSSTVKLYVEPLPCNRNWADVEGGAGAHKPDGDVDMNDFGIVQACYTSDSGNGFDFGYCRCFDRAGTANAVDSTDMAMFMACATGASVPAPVVCGATPVYSDDFDTDTSANWTVRTTTADASVVFAYDYSAQGIPSAPNSVGGTTKGLKLNVNLNTGTGTTGFAAIAFSNQAFSGDYTLHFDVWMNWATGDIGTTTMSLFGVNGDSTLTPLPAPTSGAAATPGVCPVNAGYLFGAEADAGAANRNFRAYEGAAELLPSSAGWVGPGALGSQAPFKDIWPSPKAVLAGAVGNGTGTGWGWVRGEVIHSQTNGTITLKLNDTVVATRSVSAYPSGELMLGVEDLFPTSKMTATMYTVFDNVLVTTP